MPNRILKDSICTSEEIELLSDQEEVFFYRLIVVCDDFGLMDGRPAILKARCYPLKSIDIKSIQANLAKLESIGLIRMYEVEGKPYLQLTNWAKHQQIRAKRAKFPTPNDARAINCNQLLADAPVIQSNPIQSNPNPINPLVVSELTPCPHQEIISLFAEHLPELPQVRKWEGNRATQLKARWVWVLKDLKEKSKPFDKEAGIDFFRRMFCYIRKSDFLMGRSGGFSCSLPWIVKDENFTKIIEGNYENKVAA